MKKTTKNSLAKRVAKYSALSVAIAGVADASGQVVYTDVDPDFAGGMGDSFAIDFDGDTVEDVTIQQFNNGNYELVQAEGGALGAGVAASSNGAYFYAVNFSSGATIDGGAAYNSFGDMCSGVGYAGSQFCGMEGYIGVEFTAGAGGTTHYAWVRVGTTDSSNFTVLEYAFEATPDTAILAGDQGLSVGDNAFQNFVQFVDTNNNLNMVAQGVIEDVTIYSISGQQVVSTTINNSRGTVALGDLSNGIYLANVTIDGQRKTFKIAR